MGWIGRVHVWNSRPARDFAIDVSPSPGRSFSHLILTGPNGSLPLLTTLFPMIQFIVSTHSPVIISSVPGAVVYDLERQSGVRSESLMGASRSSSRRCFAGSWPETPHSRR